MAIEDAKAAEGAIDSDNWGYGKPGEVAATCPKCKHEYRIHPAIGVARVGNSETEYFLGAEIGRYQVERFFTLDKDPKSKKHPVETQVAASAQKTVFKDKKGVAGAVLSDKGRIRRQGARFRIIEYTQMKDGSMKWTREITSDEAEITWKVEVANKKATFYEFTANELGGLRTGPAIAPPAKTIKIKKDFDPKKDGLAREELRVGAPVRFTSSDEPIDYLGEILHDPKGRLIFLGGRGRSGSRKKVGDPDAAITVYNNNPDWVDDVCDGHVAATLKFPGKKPIKTADNDGDAWVMVGPPDFGPELTNVVSMYDTMLDVACRKLVPKITPANKIMFEIHGVEQRSKADFQPYFDYDLLRLLEATYQTATVFAPANPAMKHPAVYKLAKNTHLDDPTEDPTLAAKGMAPRKHLRYKIFNTLRPPSEFLRRDPDDPPIPAGSFENAPVEKLYDPSDPVLAAKEIDERVRYETYRWTMPMLYNDMYPTDRYTETRLAVTETQYKIVKAWYLGKFHDTTEPSFDKIPRSTAITPGGLDRAALDRCVGGAFFPGIEASWLTRSDEIYVEPFRVKRGLKVTSEIVFGPFTSKGIPAAGAKVEVQPGFFSQQMAQPWQADFKDCLRGVGSAAGILKGRPLWIGWWPAARPDDVIRGDLAKADPVAMEDPTPVQKTARTVTVFKASASTDLAKHSRNVTITVGGAKPDQAPLKAVVKGKDEAGNPLIDTIELTRTAGTAAGKFLFKTVTEVAYDPGKVPDKLDATVSIGVGKESGAPEQPGTLEAATPVESAARTVTTFDATTQGALAKTPRPILFTTGGAKAEQAPMTATVEGTGADGKALSETVPLPRTAGTAVTAAKFASVARVVYAKGEVPATLDATVSIGFGEFMGDMVPWDDGIDPADRHMEMVNKWWRLGFVAGGHEIERDPDL